MLSGIISGISKYTELILSMEFTLKAAIRLNADMLVQKLFPDKAAAVFKEGTLEDKTQHLFELLAFRNDFTDDFISVFFAVNESKATKIVQEAIEAQFAHEEKMITSEKGKVDRSPDLIILSLRLKLLNWIS